MNRGMRKHLRQHEGLATRADVAREVVRLLSKEWGQAGAVDILPFLQAWARGEYRLQMNRMNNWTTKRGGNREALRTLQALLVQYTAVGHQFGLCKTADYDRLLRHDWPSVVHLLHWWTEHFSHGKIGDRIMIHPAAVRASLEDEWSSISAKKTKDFELEAWVFLQKLRALQPLFAGVDGVRNR